MLKDITIGRYIDTDSPLHRVDARSKIIAAAVYAVIVILCGNFASLAVVIVFNIIAVYISKIPVKYILKGLKPIMWFVVFTVCVNLIGGEGDAIFTLGRFRITADGIYGGCAAALKLIFFVTGTSLLTLTTPPIRLTDGLARLIKPLKLLRVPTDDIAMMISLALRFIPTFADEAERIMKAQRSRGANFAKGGAIGRVKALVSITVPLFMSVFRRADELSLAMDARCYGMGVRNPRKKTHLCGRDAVLFAACALFCFFSLIMKFTIEF